MIDLHIHLLPGVDDGPSDLAEAAAMCRQAASDGCTVLVATPHQRCGRWWNTEPERLEELRRAVAEAAGTAVEVRLGAEIRVDSDLLEDVEGLPASGLLPLAGSRFLLVEFDRYGLGPEPEPVIDELLALGWRPLVAHPEFVPQLAGNPQRAARLVASGARLQVTAASVVGRFGRLAQRATHELLDAGLVHVLASDAHGPVWRPPGLTEARSYVSGRWGEAAATLLTERNPRAVLENREIGL